jgi:hypothetical protein
MTTIFMAQCEVFDPNQIIGIFTSFDRAWNSFHEPDLDVHGQSHIEVCDNDGTLHSVIPLQLDAVYSSLPDKGA